MKKLNLVLSLALVMVVLLPASSVQANNAGVDDLRGRWDLEWYFNGGENDAPPPLILYINDLRPDPLVEGRYFAAGCMRSPDTDAIMPLSMRADYAAESNSYGVVILSTVAPPEGFGEPFVMRFDGQVDVNGEGVTDDAASGALVTEFANGGWTGSHHDRRRTKCPGVGDFGLGVQGDVYAHQDLAFDTPRFYSLYEVHTTIVSSGLLVEAPDGTSFVVQEYTDIFSPSVDFIGRFRYLTNFEGMPISGGTYHFVLLDIFGEPIAGTESSDVWEGCNQESPVNLIASPLDGNIKLVWDAVSDVTGQFQPGADPQIGFYQIGVAPFNWEGDADYGANGIKSPEHVIPVNPFTPGEPGQPDGWDYGQPLSEFPDGLYQVQSEAFSEPAPGSGGTGHECAVFNSAEQLYLQIVDGKLSFDTVATISGRVTDESGLPLAGIDVGACDYTDQQTGFCGGNRTDGDGFYTIVLPAGTYRVGAHPESGYIHEFYEETPDWNQADAVQAFNGQDTPFINFTLAPAGTISGRVFDSDGNPLGGIAVDVQDGGFGTCTDELGFYTLAGLPFGTYNVVAGRQFCGEHPYAEQTVSGIGVDSDTPDVGGVDFHLNLADDYQPTLHVVPAYPEIHGHNWNPQATVTIYVDDDDNLGNGYLYTESKLVTAEPTWCLAPCFDVSQVSDLPDGILPGYVVTMTDGAATRIVHTTNLAWTGADQEANTVFGTASPSTWIEVTVHGPEWGQRMVQADANGEWVADFSVPGTEDFEQDILDLGPGYHGRAIQFEAGIPDDGTLAYWYTPEIMILAHPDHEWVFSNGWAVGAEITMYVDDNGNPFDGYDKMLTQTATPADWDASIGEVSFSDWAPFDLAAGLFVTVTDGSIVESLQVEALSVDLFDESAVTVVGTAPPGREVGVGVHQPDGDFWLVVTSDADGNWFADFAAENINVQDVYDIHAMVWDQDGDSTQANYTFP